MAAQHGAVQLGGAQLPWGHRAALTPASRNGSQWHANASQACQHATGMSCHTPHPQRGGPRPGVRRAAAPAGPPVLLSWSDVRGCWAALPRRCRQRPSASPAPGGVTRLCGLCCRSWQGSVERGSRGTPAPNNAVPAGTRCATVAAAAGKGGRPLRCSAAGPGPRQHRQSAVAGAGGAWGPWRAPSSAEVGQRCPQPAWNLTCWAANCWRSALVQPGAGRGGRAGPLTAGQRPRAPGGRDQWRN